MAQIAIEIKKNFFESEFYYMTRWPLKIMKKHQDGLDKEWFGQET